MTILVSALMKMLFGYIMEEKIMCMVIGLRNNLNFQNITTSRITCYSVCSANRGKSFDRYRINLTLMSYN